MGKKLTIVYLVRPADGGIKSHLLALLSGLDATRFTPIVVCPPASALFNEVSRAGYTVIPLNLVGELNPTKDLSAAYQLRRILNQIRPDILHIHSAKAGFVGRLAVASMRRRPRVVMTAHSFIFDERVSPRKRALMSWIERRLLRYTDRMIAVSTALRGELVTEMRLDPAKIDVIYSGIEFADYEKSPHAGMRVGTMARLAPQKGVEYFVEAAASILAKFPLATFTIIGDGPFRPHLEELADKLGIREAIEFTGFRSDALEIVKDFDVFVLASTSETFGLSLVEALSQSVPVVASKVGGIPEIIDGKSTGLLAEPGNPDDIAGKVCRLLEDRRFAEQLAHDGCAFVRAHFSRDRMVIETEKLYDSLVIKAL